MLTRERGEGMLAFINKLEKVARHPYAEILIGTILVYTGFSEAGGTLIEDVSSGNLGAHHGVIALGVAHAMKALPSLLAALMLFSDADRKEN